jgi:hypothetical protein
VNGEEKCGGVVEKLKKKLKAVNSQSMNVKTMTKMKVILKIDSRIS